MARHTITLPIIKSSNDFGYSANTDAYYDPPYGVSLTKTSPQAIGTTLTVCHRYDGAKSRMGLAWDSELIPKGYDILNATLYVYTTKSHSKSIHYKYADFSEGGAIPSHEPSEGNKSGANSGWNTIDLGKPKGNSVILYAELGQKRVYVYNYEGQLIADPYVSEIWRINSHRNSTNKPYVIIEYGDTPPDAPTSLYPSGATLSTRDIIRFAWSHNSPSGTSQKSFDLEYSLNGGSTWIAIAQTTLDQFYDMPVQTLPISGTVRWRVRTTDFNDETSEYSTATFMLGIPPQKAPIPVSPISQYIDEKDKIRFEWIFTGGSASDTQSKADVEYSLNSGTTWTTASLTTANNYYELEALTLPKGNVVWRVKTYNAWNEASPYSEVKSFVIIGSPSTPLITDVSNKARPIIKWQTQEQQIYELEVLKEEKVIYKTGFIPDATVREHSIIDYLDNGEYLVRLRIINEFNLYSPWAERRFTISVIKPDSPNIIIYNGSYKVTIKTNSLLKSYVYRDGLLLGESINGIFEDYTGANHIEYKYFVRNIDTNDSFNDSLIKIGKIRLSSNTIATIDNPKAFVKLEYGLDAIPGKNSNIKTDATLQHYDGREYPVVEYSEFGTEEKVLSFHMETMKEVRDFINLIRQRKSLVYRDIDGDVVIGNVLALSYTKGLLGYSVDFTIARVV